MSGALLAGAALLLLALLGPVAYAVLRARSRARIVSLRGRTVAALVALSAAGPLVVELAPIDISLRIHSILPLIGALLLALLAFAVVVAAPLAALLAAAVWLLARRRRGAARSAS